MSDASAGTPAAGSVDAGPVHTGPVLAVDVGGTKLAAGIVGDDGALARAARVDTPAGRDPERLFAALLGLIETVVGEVPGAGPALCGVGCGGPMENHGELVSPLNIPAWRRFPLRKRLATELGMPVHVDNDAKALALGEGWCGAAQGAPDYLAMVVSTGVGGGIVLDGRLLDGGSGNAGHIGHVVVEPDGRLCECGGRGCLEAEASGSAIAAITGRPAAEADAAMVERTGTLVGRGVAAAVSLLDLPLAVVAGSVALGFGAPFFAAANAELEALARLDFARGARIVPAGLGGNAPLVGAAAVARHAFARA